MDEQRPEQPTADTQAGRAGIVRELFDINSMYNPRTPAWPRWLGRLVLFGVGSGIGGILWRVVDDSAGDRSFGERMLTNVYIWATLIATGLYALHDWRMRRQNAETAGDD
ncbi:hypothetical protein [Kribbella catacumbae]|uniref:hypothetical protein n=1 Tax=Kribbella catacumbae TaxID=460086 RepID=UPI0003610806|nr:hypothetical protein [Kribbella catacumbae]